MIISPKVIMRYVITLILCIDSVFSQASQIDLIRGISDLQSVVLNNQGIRVVSGSGKDESLFYELAIQRQKLKLEKIKPAVCQDFINESYKVSCDLMRLSDMFFNYDWPRYAELQQQMLEKYPKLKKEFLMPIDNFDMLINSPRFQYTGDNKEYTFHFSSIDNDFLNVFETLNVPVKINGEKTKAIFDTGASMSLISNELAKKSNAKLLPFTSELSSFYGISAAIRFALISKLEIGNEIFENIIVAVYGNKNLIGLDVMSKFNRLSLSHDALVLNAGAITNISACKSPVKLKSNFSRTNQTLATTISFNNANRDANIDTGNHSGYLTHFILPKDYKSGAVVGGNKDVVGTQGMEKIEIQKIRLGTLKEIDIKVNSVVGSKKIIENGREFILGAHLLRDYNIYLDFKNGWGCIYNAS